MFCILCHLKALLWVRAGKLGKGIVAEIVAMGRDCATHFVMHFICMNRILGLDVIYPRKCNKLYYR